MERPGRNLSVPSVDESWMDGLSAADVLRQYPETIVIDIGSALDTICTKRDTRGFGHVHGIYHDQLCDYLRPIVPENWDKF